MVLDIILSVFSIFSSWAWNNVAVVIALIGLIISIGTVHRNNVLQKNSLLTDMVKLELQLRLEANNQKNQEVLLNFAEFFAFLIKTKQISEKNARQLIEDEFLKLERVITKDYKKQLKENDKLFEHLRYYVDKWSD